MSTDPNLQEGSTPVPLDDDVETMHVWPLVGITGAVSCVLLLLMFGFFLYHNRKKSSELEAIRVMIADHISRSENSSQEARSQVSNPPLHQSPVAAQQPRMLTMFEHLGEPTPDASTTVEDRSSPALLLQSPFSAHNMTMPNPFGGSDDEMSLSGMDGGSLWSRGFHHLSDRGGFTADLDKDCDTCEPQYPELSYDIKLLDVELHELGKGACGHVKEAIYVTPNGAVRHVAAKYAHRTSANSPSIFRSELEIISKLPLQRNIVHYFGGNIAEMEIRENSNSENCFIVMELMFTNLQDVIHGKLLSEQLSYGLILRISLDVVTGLDHLHKHGIIHYDLKPSNVLLNEDFVAKLADFGSSKRTIQSRTTGTFRGTLGYIAPEVLLCQFVRKMRVTEKLDIYSLGVLIWEMVTGRHPPDPTSSYSSSFKGSFSWSVEIRPLASHFFLHTDPERCPPSLRSLIEECLSTEPDERPSTKDVKQRLLQMYTAHRSP